MHFAAALVSIALRRLLANAGLAACALLALTLAAALAASVPIYAEGASLRLLQSGLERQEQRQARSPFALLFRYVAGQGGGPLLWGRAAAADAYLSREAPRALGLPLEGLARHARTAQLRLLLPPPPAGGPPPAGRVSLGFISGMEGRLRVVDGRPPGAPGAPGAPIEVLASRALADTLGVNVGDELALVDGRARGARVRISGLWAPAGPDDPAWFYPPEALADVLLAREEIFAGPDAWPLDQALWFLRLDGSGLDAATAAPLLGRVERARSLAAGMLPGLRLEQSPAEALAAYRRAADALSVQLAAVAVPTLGLVLYFTALVAGLLVQRQRGEIALLVTRGVAAWQILLIAATEWLLLGALAALLGPPLGLALAGAVAGTSSLLRFDPGLPRLALSISPAALGLAGATTALALLAALAPSLAATGRTLADEQRHVARPARPPLWRRAYLDLLLLPPALYGLHQLRQGGGLLGAVDPFANPLTLAVPALLCLSLGLLAVRLAPPLLALLVRLAARPAWVAPLVALRALARQPAGYGGPLLMLILTLGLAIFSAALAATADRALEAAVRYQVGADAQLREAAESTERPRPGEEPAPKDIREEPRFLFVPVGEHLTVPGIRAAARVGTYRATAPVGGQPRDARLVGVDRLGFPGLVTRFERGWAGGESLGGLMNRLAAAPDGAIVSRELLAGGLQVGDLLPVSAELFGDRRELRLRIVAAADLWPGYYPQDGPLIVVNLDYLFDQMGGQYPYDVWIARDPAVPLAELEAGVRRLGVDLVATLDARSLEREERLRPQRQGLFGMLSVGFLAAGGLTLVSFVLSALITARRRTVELGVLRALGMSARAAAAAILIEQGAVILAGLAGGLAIGSLTAALVVPALQVGAGPWPGTPPVAPLLPWAQVALLGLIAALALALAVLALVALQGRLRAFQAVKLGEVV